MLAAIQDPEGFSNWVLWVSDYQVGACLPRQHLKPTGYSQRQKHYAMAGEAISDILPSFPAGM